MCHEPSARPPAAPVVGEIAHESAGTLVAADGTEFAVQDASPATPNGRSVLILPDVRGLHPYYRALTARFAEAGFEATALDYFGRTAGVEDRDEGFDWQPHVAALDEEHVIADATAALAHLRGRSDGPVYTVGFCLGGSNSWRLAATDLDLAGCVGFYGKPQRVQHVLADIHKPLLMLVAGADAATPLQEFEDFHDELIRLGAPVTKRVYEGAPHSFFDRSYGDWASACDDAWRQILDFTGVPALA